MADPLFCGTQHPDMVGRIEVDGHEGAPLDELGRIASVPNTHWVIGFKLGGFDPATPDEVGITVIAVPGSVGTRTEEVGDYQNLHGKIPAESFQGKIRMEDFPSLFKRVDLAVVRQGILIDKIEIRRGRET